MQTIPDKTMPMIDDFIYDIPVELTANQREAVFFGEGPLLVVAGAGTGKTMCIAHRVANLITSLKAGMDEVLILTFSEKAAQQMEERIDILLPYAFSDIWVSTFHSFGQKILRRHAMEAGIFPDFRVLSPEEMIVFLTEHLFELPLERFRPPSNPAFHLNAIVKLISRLKDEDISPEEYLKFVESIDVPEGNEAAAERKTIHRELALTYRAVQALMYEKGFVDMADLVYMPLQIFREHPLIAEEYRQQFKYILVDEFQDTNYSQYELLKLLAAGNRNITVVGDDDQSIYKFRGAAISNILSFIDDYPDAHQIVLANNFRSPQLILDAAYRLIEHNNPYRMEVKNKIDKKLKGKFDSEAVLSHKVFDTEQAQSEAIAELIAKKREQGMKYSDIAILVRANRNADSIIREFNLKDIPYTYSGNTGLYMRSEVRTILSFFRALTRPDDSTHLYYLAGSEIYGLDPEALTVMTNYADRANIPLENVFKNSGKINQLRSIPESSRKAAKKIAKDVEHFRELSLNLTAGRLLFEFLTKTGYMGKLAQQQVKFAELKTKNIALFFEIIKGYESISEYPFALPFIRHIDNLIRAGDDPPAAQEEVETDAVSIMSVHKAKGLEFPVVVIAGIAEGNFPSQSRGETIDVPDELVKERMISDEFHMQEERRLFYVAMTRAKKELYLLGVRDFGGKRLKKISRFLMEALDTPVGSIKVKVTPPDEAIARFGQESEPSETELTSLSGDVFHLHVNQFDDYISCPLRYKYVHILKVPVLYHHRIIFGKAIREAVLNFLRRKANNIPTDPEDLYRVFAREWTQEGFLTKKHEEIRFEEGKKALDEFCASCRTLLDKGDAVDREYRFYLDGIKIGGKWDLLRNEPDGSVIYAFRSSDVREKKAADRKAASSLRNQISILAHQELYGELPKALNSYYVSTGIVGAVKPQKKKLITLKEDMKKAVEGIRRADFTPAPEKFKCSICVFMDICPATAKEL